MSRHTIKAWGDSVGRAGGLFASRTKRPAANRVPIIVDLCVVDGTGRSILDKDAGIRLSEPSGESRQILGLRL